MSDTLKNLKSKKSELPLKNLKAVSDTLSKRKVRMTKAA